MWKRIIFRFLFLAVALCSALFLGAPKIHAACTPGQGGTGTKLTDCYFLNDNGKLVGTVYDKPSVLVNLLSRNIFIIGGIIILGLVIYAGFLSISGGTKGQDQAKTVATTAAVGFILMFSAYWILQIVKILTGADIGL
jgi:hypothetical protein